MTCFLRKPWLDCGQYSLRLSSEESAHMCSMRGLCEMPAFLLQLDESSANQVSGIQRRSLV